jgi:outer membrane protein TolC
MTPPRGLPIWRRAAWRVGAAPAIDRTRAQLESNRRRHDESLHRRSSTAQAPDPLANELGVDIAEAVDVVAAAPLVEPEALPSDAELATALSGARDTRPEIVAARARLESAEAQRRAANLGRAPTLGAYGKAGALTDLEGYQAAPLLEAGLVATVPLFEGGGRNALQVRQSSALSEADALAPRHRGARRGGRRPPSRSAALAIRR